MLKHVQHDSLKEKPLLHKSTIHLNFAHLKKLFAISLLGLLLFLVAGYHFYFSLRLLQVKKEMKESLSSVNRSSLQVFHFNKTDFEKLAWDGEDEFNWNGNMYDVVEKHEDNGVISISCIADKKETELLVSQLHARERSNKNSLIIIKLISIPFVVKDMNQSVVLIKGDKEQYSSTSKLFSSFHPAAFPQPPENC